MLRHLPTATTVDDPAPQIEVSTAPTLVVSRRAISHSPLGERWRAIGSGLAVAVNVTGEPVRPSACAVTDCAPRLLPSVHVTDATPCASVGVAVSEIVPPPVVTDQ